MRRRAPVDLMPAAPAQAMHRTTPSARGWSLWRLFQCRNAGFDASTVLALADEACALSADALAEARKEAATLWLEVERAIATQKNRLLHRQSEARADSAEYASFADAIKATRAAQKAAAKHRLSAQVLREISAERAAALTSATQRCERLEADYAGGFAQASRGIVARLQSLAGDTRFREAVIWQNKDLARRVLTPFARGQPGRDPRRDEEVIAGYLQRYCAKNDTIGFFGPVGWGTWTDGAALVLLLPSPAAREPGEARFEAWAIQALAERMSTDSRLAPWRPVTRAPYLNLDGVKLRLPGGGATTLTQEVAEVLRCCARARAARGISTEILRHPFLAFDAEAEVLEVLRDLAQARRVHLGFAVRHSDAQPLAHLSAEIALVDDPALRGVIEAQISTLALAKAAVDAAAGNPEALAPALEVLDLSFEAATGVSATRNQGQTYGARTIVYRDHRWDAEARLGVALREMLQPPLDIVLDGARWFCHEAALIFRDSLVDLHARLAGGTTVVDLPTFWLHAQDLFFGAGPHRIADLQARLGAKWSALLRVDAGGECIALRSEDLAVEAATTFATLGAGWRGALHHCPDIMIAASNLAAVERGEVTFVLGEVHVGYNTLAVHTLVDQLPDPTALLDMLHADLVSPRIIPITSVVGEGAPIRTQVVTDRRRDIELCLSYGAPPLEPERALASADLVIERVGASLRMRERGGRGLDVDVLDAFGLLLSGFIADKFSILPPQPAVPRIAIDQLVIQRRTWRISGEALAFLAKGDDADRFVALRRWARQNGLPRWLFVRAPHERKPFYLDLCSPLLMRLLATQVRKALRDGSGKDADFALSEMLPAHGEIWMPLARGGGHCTSEFRFVAVHEADLRGAQDAP